MANTNKDNVLTLAPELTTFIQNTREIINITINTAEDDRDYTITIDDIDYTIDSGAGATVSSIATALKAKIDLASLGLNIVDNLDGTLAITSENSGIRFDINSDIDQYITVELDTIAGLGSNLLRLIMYDVQAECTYQIYKDEQERAQRYLAAHLLTVLYQISSGASSSSSTPSGNIIREKVGDVETWYSDAGFSVKLNGSEFDLMSTTYGRVFLGIQKRHAGRFI